MSALDRFTQDSEKGYLDVIPMKTRLKLAIFSSLYEQNAAIITASIITSSVLLAITTALESKGISFILPFSTIIVLLIIGTPDRRNRKAMKEYIAYSEVRELGTESLKVISGNKVIQTILGILRAAGYRKERLSQAYGIVNQMNLSVNQYMEIESARRFALLAIAAESVDLSPEEYFSLYSSCPDLRDIKGMTAAGMDTELIRATVG